MVKVLEIREKAKKELGGRFNIKDFSLQGYQLHMTNMTSIIKNHEKLRKAFLKAVKIVLDI